jgi:4-diphosphocytidyl-2-C-methyl-D-erythritol kinase
MTVKAYAKVNLTLEILARRCDGYHDLRSVVLPVSLADTLEIAPSDEITSDGAFANDLCLKAAVTLAQATGTAEGAAIHVEKRIPVGGGLGGGSADAAAVLRALNEMWRINMPLDELARLGAQVGSDVPALVLGGAVLMEGRGEKVSRFDFPARRLEMVLANPGVESSTRDVYAAYSGRLQDKSDILYNIRQVLHGGSIDEIASVMANDLQASAVRLYPEIGKALADLSVAGAKGAMVSGSGSTVYGLVPNEAQGLETAARMEAMGYWARSVHVNCPVM